MMKFVIPALGLAVAGCAAQEPIESTPADEARLAAAIEGRVAGDPVSCVSMRDVRGNRSVGEGAIVFDSVGGGTIYVNRPPAGCPVMRSGYALRLQTTTAQLCRGDVVSVFDPVNGIDIGSCGLGEFTPYRRR